MQKEGFERRCKQNDIKEAESGLSHSCHKIEQDFSLCICCILFKRRLMSAGRQFEDLFSYVYNLNTAIAASCGSCISVVFNFDKDSKIPKTYY